MKTLGQLIREKQEIREPNAKELNQLIAYKMINKIINHTATPEQQLILEQSANLIEDCYNKLEDE